jgi:hypothetical protein
MSPDAGERQETRVEQDRTSRVTGQEMSQGTERSLHQSFEEEEEEIVLDGDEEPIMPVDLIGRRVAVEREKNEFYTGTVRSYAPGRNKWRVEYDDGEACAWFGRAEIISHVNIYNEDPEYWDESGDKDNSGDKDESRDEVSC